MLLQLLQSDVSKVASCQRRRTYEANKAIELAPETDLGIQRREILYFKYYSIV